VVSAFVLALPTARAQQQPVARTGQSIAANFRCSQTQHAGNDGK